MPQSTVFLISSLLALGGVSALSKAVEVRYHPRDLQKRAEVDCGTWVMQCGGVRGGDGTGIEELCNNACFFQKHMYSGDGPYVGTYNTAVDGDHNRAHSGCQVDGKSVCKLMPFSQKILDGFNLNDPTCEEFPMADWSQPDFENGKGQPRNALRCVERKINSAGGGQWLSFRDGKGDQPKRTCDGPMNQDNTDYKFTIEMNTDNANQDLLGYCLSDSQGPANPDPHEFYMDTFSSPNGANHFPMQSSDNLYDTAAKWSGLFQVDLIWQCRVEILRTAGDSYSVSMHDAVEDKELARAAQGLHNDGEKIVLSPADSAHDWPDLWIIRTGEMGKGGTPGSRIDFVSAHTADGENPMKDFKFTTESQGWDPRHKQVDDSNKGYYCDVPNINDSSENGPSQQITCYYPCSVF